MKTAVLALFIINFSHCLFAQYNTFNAEEFLSIVRSYHPVVRLANINIEQSDADILVARNIFNPIISNYIANKTINNIEYYNYLHPQITIPTWFGINVSAGLENLSGNRFDPSETIGQSSYVGVSIPLLNNWVIDKRRAYLQKAKLYNELAIIDQQKVVNDVLKDAITTYWEWVNAYESYEIVGRNYDISQQRFNFVKQTVINGERPAIDSIEALTQLQSMEFLKNERWFQFQNKGIELSVFLWNENNMPFDWQENIIPQSGWENQENIEKFILPLSDLLQNAKEFHPEIRMFTQKTYLLNIEKKLKFQELFPKLDFNYYHFNKGLNQFSTDGLFFQNNFQYGLKFEMPLFLSKSRGEYKKAKLNLQANFIMQAQKVQGIEQKVELYYNQYLNLKKQIMVQSNMLQNFRKLLKAEETLFQNGESSLFLINSRENKVLETENKLVELKTKYFKSIYDLQWAAGLLQ